MFTDERIVTEPKPVLQWSKAGSARQGCADAEDAGTQVMEAGCLVLVVVRTEVGF